MQLAMRDVKFQAWGFRLQTGKDASPSKGRRPKIQKKRQKEHYVIIGYILGLYGDNGKETGNYYVIIMPALVSPGQQAWRHVDVGIALKLMGQNIGVRNAVLPKLCETVRSGSKTSVSGED